MTHGLVAEQARGKGQQGGFRGGDETTHILVAEQRRGRVSGVDFGDEMRRRTYWWRNSAVEGSAAWISGWKRSGAQTGGRTPP